MAKLKLKGKVTYPPGPWGNNKPVKGAKIKITDIDAPGRTNDVIWEGTTENDGVFQGTSKEWQDRIHSPDGKMIAFNNFINGKADILIMNIDGSDITALTNDTLDNRWPRFTPDGKFIAYTRVAGRNSDIWIMDNNGNNKKEFITSPQRDEILELRPINK